MNYTAEQNDTIPADRPFDFSGISESVRWDIARTVLKAVRESMGDPTERAIIEAQIAKDRAEKARKRKEVNSEAE